MKSLPLHAPCIARDRRNATRLPGLIRLLALWASRIRQRRDLAALPPERLADIGIDADMARGEYVKPFWRA